MTNKRIGALAIASLISSLAVVPQATAAVDGSAPVISEVYGGGGNSGAVYTNDFIELYNPTDTAVDLTGWSVEYFSAKGSTGGTTALSGTIPAKGHFLIQEGAGATPVADLPTPDATGTLNMAGTNGAIKLYDAVGTAVDVIGYGTATIFEAAAASALSNSTSASRGADGADTDNNAADFTVGAPNPQNSGSVSTEPTTPVDPTTTAPAPTDVTTPAPTDPATTTATPVDPTQPNIPAGAKTIAEIQGTGAATPLSGQTVTTYGVVTAVWNEGGKNGFVIQTPGSGTVAPAAGAASEGLFIYMGTRTDYPTIGDSVVVTGQATEFYNLTQVKAASITKASEPFAAVTPLKIDKLPAGDAARESYESMLVLPGTHTVTDNYSLNTYGEIGLADGLEALRQPSDVESPSTDPSSPLQQLARENQDRIVYLDDARTKNYMTGDKLTPLPYISQDGGKTIKSIRTTDQVAFADPVVVDFANKFWRFQPTTPVTGNTAGADLPITWEDSRAKELTALDVAGDYTLSTFNVLNYFTSLGETYGGTSYTDRDGNPVTVKSGTTRGAWTPEALADQQAKIVAAINGLNSDVVALMEIENTAAVTGNPAGRDNALKTLTAALNAAGGNWEYVESPSTVPTGEDVIRTAFIYKKDRVEPVGESRIFDDPRFNTARDPLAQEFKALDPAVTETFVAIANHFKSKGSVALGDADTGDGQGNNPNVRMAQSQAVLDNLAKQADWADKPVFVMGDLNSYTHETAIDVFRTAGYSVPAEDYNADASYLFGGLLGSLDHVLANEVAKGKVQDAQVWNINADESVAFEYSRRNYNVVDFYDASPFRSSDHDPVKVGFNLSTTVTSTPASTTTSAPATSESSTSIPEPTPSEPTSATSEPTPAPAPFVTDLKLDDAGVLTAVYSDGTEKVLGNVTGPQGEPGATGAVGQDGKDAVAPVIAIGENGNWTINGDDTGVAAQGKDGVDGIDGVDGKDAVAPKLTIGTNGNWFVDGVDTGVSATGPKGDAGAPGTNGTDGADGADGADGRGITEILINDKGELVVKFSDNTESNLGSVKGANGADGVNGTNGQDGRGIAATTINEAGELVITYTDGTAANLGVVEGANGTDGANGVDGKDGRGIASTAINKADELIVTYTDGVSINLGSVKGTDGAAGVDGKDGIGIVSTTINANGELELTYTDGTKVNLGSIVGTNGINGTDGTDGTDGKDGRGIAATTVNDKGELVVTFTDGETQNLGVITGTNGADGKDGADGIDGVDGKDGQDGRGIATAAVNEAGELVVTFTDGATQNLGVVAGVNGTNGTNGADGKDGKDGRGIAATTVNEAGELVITYTDGTTQNLGSVRGADGKDGQDGKDGINGVDGADGVGVQAVTINEVGELIVKFTNGTVSNLGAVKGADGVNGKDGRGVTQFAINAKGELVVTYSDGTTANLGVVAGKNGRGVARLEMNADGNIVATYTDGTTETLAASEKFSGNDAPKQGSSAGDRCLSTVLGLTIPASLAGTAAAASQMQGALNIPGLAEVQKQIHRILRATPKIDPKIAGIAGGIAGLALVGGIIAAACAPGGSSK